MKYNTDLTDLCVRRPYTSIPSKGLACVAGGIVSAREIKFWTSERPSREENGERDSEIGISDTCHQAGGREMSAPRPYVTDPFRPLSSISNWYWCIYIYIYIYNSYIYNSILVITVVWFVQVCLAVVHI